MICCIAIEINVLDLPSSDKKIHACQIDKSVNVQPSVYRALVVSTRVALIVQLFCRIWHR